MKIKEVLLGIIIAVVFLMFCVFGAKLIYDSPKYEEYCDYSKMVNVDGKPINQTNFTEQEIAYKECSDKYETARENHSQKMFILSLLIGIIVIVGCAIAIEIGTISGGLMFGSLMFIIYGTGSYWNYMDDLGRFIILGISLGILIYVGYWINKKQKKKRK